MAAVALTSLSARELAGRIAAGEISSAEAVEAHIARIEEVDGRLNAVCVPLFEEARAAAARADLTPEPAGPLHGVPITVKECFDVAGTATTLGLSARVGQLAASDGPLVARMRAAGAVILGKTNLPQLLMYSETENPVYGTTRNPWDLDRAPGGSSGGEAAIIAAGGSPLGLGTDIGGSVRIPAHHSGIHALKPTSMRLTTVGTGEVFPGQEAILDAAGPMARHVEDLWLAMEVLARPRPPGPVDPAVPPVPLGDPSSVDVSGLRVAWYDDDGFFGVSPGIRRAVREAAEVLESLGAQVRQWTPPDLSAGIELYFALLGADGGARLREWLRGSEPDPRNRLSAEAGRVPGWGRPALARLARITGQQRLGSLAGAWGKRSTADYQELIEERNVYRRRFAEALDEEGVDVLLAPPYALPALRHGNTGELAVSNAHSVIYNLLGMPAGVVAATRIRADEETDRSPGVDRVERAARDLELGSAGLPVGVQVAGRWWEEHVVIAAMAALEAELRTRPDYPTAPTLQRGQLAQGQVAHRWSRSGAG